MNKRDVTMRIVPSLSDEAFLVDALGFSAEGRPGINYCRVDANDGQWVECLLRRDATGDLRGVLTYFPFAIPPERKGSFIITVDPEWRRRGVATALLDKANARWSIDFNQQNYTLDGAAFVMAWLNRFRSLQLVRRGIQPSRRFVLDFGERYWDSKYLAHIGSLICRNEKAGESTKNSNPIEYPLKSKVS